MRRHRVPLGWPRRDPRHYRFAVPNEVWEYKIRPMEFLILSYLCYWQTHDKEEKTVSATTVANSLHLTAPTVEKHFASLVSKGIVTDDGTPLLKCEAGKFFTLPNEIFLLNLPPSAFVVYAYLLLIESRRTNTCHPSYNTIAAETGLSKNTVLKSVGVLLEKKLITVEATNYFDKHGMKWKGNNLYTILPIKVAVEDYHQRLFQQLELATERSRIRKRQAKRNRPHPTAALCASTPTPAAPDPSPAI